MMSFRKSVAAALGAAALLASAALAHEYDVGKIHIDHPWTRATPASAPVAGAYMVLENNSDAPDRLIGGSTPIAKDVQVHSMSMENGVMKMRQLTDGLEIPAHGKVELSPAGFHLMLVGLKHPVEAGGKRIPVTLTFEQAGTVEVELAIEKMGTTAPTAGHGDHAGHDMSGSGMSGMAGHDMSSHSGASGM
ncbi:copper chaperone PCu(A)C [Mangrovibrevibacter kandeliae]|uniref:copper chaperone PCu(A)C n=1 Tax=Mangrovibrevibacter kandeliae TaxID=2968473 RepID=UPI0021189807|nr:copper chaperone PCu(A)C [Aurantimonas sp. CSK15Z-1]MCQ8782968.1 copper chaperone PCu(A)C [Aurantimonas sp. CSK15Z-1]